QPRRAGETLDRMDRLRKAAAARAKPRPDLAAAISIFRDGDNDRDFGLAPRRQRAADQARYLRQPPADAAEECFLDFAGIDDGPSRTEAFGEAPPGGDRQSPPLLRRQQCAEAVIVEGFFAGRWRGRKPCDPVF